MERACRLWRNKLGGYGETSLEAMGGNRPGGYGETSLDGMEKQAWRLWRNDVNRHDKCDR